MPGKHQQPISGQSKRVWMMFPEYHTAVASALDYELKHDIIKVNYHIQNTKLTTNFWNTNMVGRFCCPSNACNQNGWSSKTIAAVIRRYADDSYNVIDYRQRCRSCGTLGDMIVDEDVYVERVVRRLKIWHGVEVDKVDMNIKKGPPHIERLCEGCKAGHCVKARRDRD